MNTTTPSPLASPARPATQPWVTVEDFTLESGWAAPAEAAARSRSYCERLESGSILFFGSLPYRFPAEDREFLLVQKWSEARMHKNVSYRPGSDVLRGAPAGAADRLQTILRNYSAAVIEFVGKFLSPYAGQWILDFASFRPLEEENRGLPLHKRNDLLHVDAFPSRPTRGGRILRVFTNLNPSRPRVWETTDGFQALAGQYAEDAGLGRIAKSRAWLPRALWPMAAKLRIAQLGRSRYDQFMLRFHDYLKENAAFQTGCPKIQLAFPPLSTWIVFTDGVPHSAQSGQYAVEQTFLVPPQALVASERAPYRILEKLAGRPLVG